MKDPLNDDSLPFIILRILICKSVEKRFALVASSSLSSCLLPQLEAEERERINKLKEDERAKSMADQ